MPSSRRRRLAAVTTATALVAGTLVAVFGLPDGSTPVAAAPCAPGFTPVPQVLAEIRQEMRGERAAEQSRERAGHAGEEREGAQFVA